MMYNDEMKCSPMPTNPVEELPLSALLGEACGYASEALIMAKSINNHMFGVGNDTEGKVAEPRCFRDEMLNHRACLNELCKELKRMMDRLGV